MRNARPSSSSSEWRCGRRPSEGRIPGDPRARAAQSAHAAAAWARPAGPHNNRSAADRDEHAGAHGPPARPHGPPDRRSDGHLPDQPRRLGAEELTARPQEVVRGAVRIDPADCRSAQAALSMRRPTFDPDAADDTRRADHRQPAHNAAKFTPDGGSIAITMTLEGAQAVMPGGRYRQGIPTDRSTRSSTCSPGWSARNLQCRSGLGIGLALARRLAEMHGGTLTAVSDGEDRGSTFTLSLPPCRRRRARSKPPLVDPGV